MSRLVAVVCVLGACSSDAESPGTGNDKDTASASEVVNTDTGDTTGNPSTPSSDRTALCTKLQTRIDACGHTYTFPGFQGWCLDESRGDEEALTTCSIRPCAMLVTCLDGAGAPSEGL